MNREFTSHVRSLGILLIGGLLCGAAAAIAIHALTTSSWFVELGAFATVVLIAIIAALVHARRTATRNATIVHDMTVTARQLAIGNYDREVAVALPECYELGEAINAIARRAQRDIGDMKRLERVRSEFLGNVSHELRTPIFSVQGFLETLIDGAVDDPMVRDDFLRKAHLNVLRLHNLLNDLIEISRIESGEMKMSFRYFDAVEYFQQIVDELQPTAEMAGVTLSLHVVGVGDDRTAYGDRDRLKQAVINLIENAIKYNRPEGTVRVELDFRDSELIIGVVDSGIGIPPEDQTRIFERFYRVDKDRSRAVGGSGLGLAIVKHIIEAHRSKINIESTPGVGSRFTFALKR
jgi:two-component system phosphate regulon sensor histidine kinase PhoR